MRDSAGYPVKTEPDFVVKDSGQREAYAGGMVRDTQDGKAQFMRLLDGPMLERWAVHLTKGAAKYPDVSPGVPNWTLAAGPVELERFQQSAFRHLLQWLRGDVDEDHAAAVLFNINGAEYVKARRAATVDARQEPIEVLDDHGHAHHVPAGKMSR